MRAAGRGRGRREDLIAPVRAPDRLQRRDPEVLQILRDQPAVVLFRLAQDLLRDPALIKRVPAAFRDGLQRSGQIRIFQHVPGFRRPAVRQVDLPAVSVGLQLFRVQRDVRGEQGRDDKAFPGQGDGRRHHGPAVQRAVMFQRIEQAGHVAGHGCRGCGIDVAQIFIVVRSLPAFGRIPSEVSFVHIRTCRSGRLFPEIQKDVFACLCRADQEESSSADAAGVRFADAQGKSHGDGCVHRVAAGSQDLFADLGRFGSAGGDDAPFRGAGSAGMFHMAVFVERPESRDHE